MHICEDCGELFTNKKLLKEHKKAHIFKEECITCDKKFRTKNKLGIHEKMEHRDKFDCQFCSDVEFKGLNYSKIKDHLIVSHFDERENPTFINIVKSDEEKNICSQCGAIFTSLKAFKNHKVRKHFDSTALKYSCND